MGRFSRSQTPQAPQPEHNGEHIPIPPLGNPPAQHPPCWGKNSTNTENSEIGFGFLFKTTLVAAATWFLYAWAIWANRDQCHQQLGGKSIHTIETVQGLGV